MTASVPPPLSPAQNPSPRLIAPGQAATIIGIIVALMLLGGLAVLFLFDPNQHGFYPRCQLYRMTGLQCPGCGGLRALHALLHGQVGEAWRLNSLFVLALPVVGLWVMSWLIRRRRAPTNRLTLPTTWIWAGLALVIVFGVVRNLPGFEWFAQ